MVPPPRVDRGTRIVKLVVGPEDDQREFVLHRDPLCASSKFFARAFAGEFIEGRTQEMKLPEEEAEIFAFFVDWLYVGDEAVCGKAFMTANNLWYTDVFWLKVYRMADRLLSPGLQLSAYLELKGVFSYKPTLPSREFIHSLFAGGDLGAMEIYVVEHVVFWFYRTQPQEKQDWARLFNVTERFGMAIASAMIRAETERDSTPHPDDQYQFDEKHGLDLCEMYVEARRADEILSPLPERSYMMQD
ncbi:hypothetical protein AYO20_04380 [Fonsecaea nubica]|uniref:BTB domain-containing protein n=1 Tax=Fonsecaea nubica TaxID=856822 RepID=A0A178D3V5_9EURO|nr:hypothetical protein AYO20_04380 [Fonsecaea nubica]OAL36222.1 hypothetical protein AYO20_04380 [Fonsecaea nubica]